MSSLLVANTESGALVMKLAGKRLDAMAARNLRPAAVEAATGRMVVVVNLYDVTFIDSTGLGCLVSVLKATPAGGQVRLVGIQPAVKTLLELTRLDRVFPAFGTVEDALAA